jgi:hypothetical protein
MLDVRVLRCETNDPVEMERLKCCLRSYVESVAQAPCDMGMAWSLITA